MKKEEIYVTIDSEEKRLRAIDILQKVNGKVRRTSFLNSYVSERYKYLSIDSEGFWTLFCLKNGEKEITLDELEELLIPNYQVKDVILSINELKDQADKLGYQLVEKPYKPKVGDFGVFYDFNENSNNLGFLTDIQILPYRFVRDKNTPFKNFRKLTEKEKRKIQEAW